MSMLDNPRVIQAQSSAKLRKTHGGGVSAQPRCSKASEQAEVVNLFGKGSKRGDVDLDSEGLLVEAAMVHKLGVELDEELQSATFAKALEKA